MADLQYLEFIKNELLKLGLDDGDVEAYALNVLKNAEEQNIPIVDILDKGLTADNITETTIDAINESRSTTSYITIRQFTPSPSKFISRGIFEQVGYNSAHTLEDNYEWPSLPNIDGSIEES